MLGLIFTLCEYVVALFVMKSRQIYMKILISGKYISNVISECCETTKDPRFVNMRFACDVSRPPAGLSRHVKTMMIEGFNALARHSGVKRSMQQIS